MRRDDKPQKRPAARTPGRPGARLPGLARALRGVRPDRNPLRRRIDRVETGVLGGLLAAAIAGAPFAAHAASQAAYENALRMQHQQKSASHIVDAKTTVAATPAGAYTGDVYVLTPARWTSLDGVAGIGAVPVLSGSKAGTKVQVWTDNRTGSLTGAPLNSAQVAGQGDAAMVGALAGMAILYTAAAAATRQVTNRRRMAAWDADWLVTARTWNRLS